MDDNVRNFQNVILRVLLLNKSFPYLYLYPICRPATDGHSFVEKRTRKLCFNAAWKLCSPFVKFHVYVYCKYHFLHLFFLSLNMDNIVTASDLHVDCCSFRVSSRTWKTRTFEFYLSRSKIAWNLLQKVRKPGQNKKFNRKPGQNLEIYNISILYWDSIFQILCSYNFIMHLVSAF